MKCACKTCESDIHHNTAVDVDGALFCCEACATGHEDPDDNHCRHHTCECAHYTLRH